MSDISKPPVRLVNEDLVDRNVTKRPVSKLTQLTEAPDPDVKKSRPKKEKPLSRAERRKLEQETTEQDTSGEASSQEFVDEKAPTTKESRLIASNPDLSEEHLDGLSKSDNEVVRMAVAGNPSSSLKTLTRMKKDKNLEVLSALIGNPKFPVKQLSGFLSLAKKQPEILEALLSRSDLTPRLEKQLSKLQ